MGGWPLILVVTREFDPKNGWKWDVGPITSGRWMA